MAQPGPASPTYDAGTPSPPISDDPPDVHPVIDPITSQWKRLAAMGRESPDFLRLLPSLITGTNRSSTIKLRGDDAAIALGALDEVCRDRRISREYERDILGVMRALAYDSSQVPPRYQIKPGILSVEDEVIGRGGFSEVRKGRSGDSIVAVKILRPDRNADPNEALKRFCKESIIWMSLSHPRLLKLIAVDINPSTGQCSMISEMMGGNIRDYIRRNNSANRLRLLHEAAMGLHYLHEREIVHGDLKGHNILITNELPARACLADFGLSTLTPSAPGGVATTATAGTPLYMAPELLFPGKFGLTKCRPTQPADIYAFGMVIYEVLTGFDPFYDRGLGLYEVVLRVSAGERPTKPGNAEEIGFGSGTWESMKNCWKQQPTRRPTVEQVLAHLARVSASSALVLHPDSHVILREWQDLASRDLGSIDQQLAPLLTWKNGNIARKFRGTDAAVVINTIDKVLKCNQVPDRSKARALSLLRQLAGASRQVPKSYQISRWTRYTVENEIFASGGFADIRQGKLGARVVAVKTIRISQVTDIGEIHKSFCKESVLWMNISHPNILKLLAVEVKPRARKFSMIAEMMTNGNITEYICVNKANRLRLLRDVADGLHHLHDIGIIHGDLKGVNILVNNETPPRACLADFALSTTAPIMSFDPTMRGETGGTPGYMAPELCQMGGNPSKAADIYAFGMVVYEVITGARPFGKRGPLQLLGCTIEGWRPPRPENPVAMFDQGTWEFVERSWDGDSEQRPTARAALQHFERVAATSTDVGPGPIPSAHGAVAESFSRLDRLDTSVRSYRGVFA